MGVASCMWVRPILTPSCHSLDFAAMASRSAFKAGKSLSLTLTAAAMFMAVGNESLDDCDMLTSSVWVNGGVAANRRARERTAAVGNHFIYVHIELRTAAGHPHVQGEHVLMLTGEDFVADLNNESVSFVFQSSICMVRTGGGLL